VSTLLAVSVMVTLGHALTLGLAFSAARLVIFPGNFGYRDIVSAALKPREARLSTPNQIVERDKSFLLCFFAAPIKFGPERWIEIFVLLRGEQQNLIVLLGHYDEAIAIWARDDLHTVVHVNSSFGTPRCDGRQQGL
jgi:hypothetical protein